MNLVFPDKIKDIYQMTPEIFDDFINKTYLKRQTHKISPKYYPYDKGDGLLSYFRYVYNFSKKLEDSDSFKKYSLGICNVILSKIYIWEEIPPIIKNNRKEEIMRILFDIEHCIDHILNLFNSTKESLNNFQNIDIEAEIFNLCVDDYIMFLTKESMNESTIESAKKSRQRDNNINNIIH